jgi:hypothetical protein
MTGPARPAKGGQGGRGRAVDSEGLPETPPYSARLLDVAERTSVTLVVRDGVPIATSEDRD